MLFLYSLVHRTVKNEFSPTCFMRNQNRKLQTSLTHEMNLKFLRNTLGNQVQEHCDFWIIESQLS